MRAFLRVFTFSVLVDVTFCALILRLLLGWLVDNPRLARLLGLLFLLACFFLGVQRSDLPATQILTAVLIIPMACLAVLNFVPDLRRAYQAATLRRLFTPRRAGVDNAVPGLASALVEMAGALRGALLVFPPGRRRRRLPQWRRGVRRPGHQVAPALPDPPRLPPA